MRIHTAMLYATDLPRLVRFYGGLLGVRAEVDEGGRWARFDLDGTDFAVHAVPAAMVAELELGSPPAPREDVPVKLLFTVDSLAGQPDRLAALGATVLDRPWGTPDYADPEGNVFGLLPEDGLRTGNVP